MGLWGWGDSAARMALAWHEANVGPIPSTGEGPLNPFAVTPTHRARSQHSVLPGVA